MERLPKQKLVLVGLTLFSMFFGAGNLIFPPFLGASAGTNIWIAMAGFAVTAIGFPVLGVVAVAKSGGLNKLAGHVHPRFAFIFILLIYLSIGPCLAIPRTASTSFEMAVVPFLKEGGSGA
ncbi:MAG: branched-chain amino acid transport system II carrier protein, partial [Lacrimispora sphenoides]